MKNGHLDRINDRIQDREFVNDGERDLVWAYKQSADKGFEVIIFDSSMRERHLEEMVNAMKAAGVNELYYSGGWSNHIERYLLLDEMGLKLRGVVRLENAYRKKELDRWGFSDQPETIAALRFSFEEDQS